MAKSTPSGEREILRQLRTRNARGLSRADIRVGIGDDCAVLTPRAGEEMLVTTDFSIEGRHFRHDWHEPESVGHKCLARGLSDIAAMGGRPLAAFVSLALPRAFAGARKKASWLERFYDGLLALADRESVTLAGGDLSESPALAVADIIVIGASPKGRALLRSTARAGDILYVTGSLGGACEELAQLEISSRRLRNLVINNAAHPHFFPQPRLAAGQTLLKRGIATSCIDISDGLSVDLLHLCEESSLAAELDAGAIPIGTGATLEQALHGGDDYELLFTARAGTRVPKQLGGVAIHPIGLMTKSRRGASSISLVRQDGAKTKRSPLAAKGWQHF